MTVATLDRPHGDITSAAQVLRIGFMPLTDSAPLLVADELGLFRHHGVSVALSPCASWAGLRDRLMVGTLDAAQILAPMPIAAALGLGGLRAGCLVTATTSRNGNTITLSEALADELPVLQRPLAAKAFAQALGRRRARGLPPPVLAVVFAFSSHNYLLRHWLASGGLDPDRDLRLVVVPPPLVSGQLASGAIDGFCAGEPWGAQAVDMGVGRIALTSADIWPDHPEKMLAFSEAAVARNAERVTAATAAVIQATGWLADPANWLEASRLLHRRALPGVPADIILLALSGQSTRAPDAAETLAAPMFVGGAATAPDPGHGAWWFNQMQRWRHVPPGEADPVPSLWRPDLWREAASLAGVPDPAMTAVAPILSVGSLE